MDLSRATFNKYNFITQEFKQLIRLTGKILKQIVINLTKNKKYQFVDNNDKIIEFFGKEKGEKND